MGTRMSFESLIFHCVISGYAVYTGVKSISALPPFEGCRDLMNFSS